jgi:hypothetical protein
MPRVEEASCRSSASWSLLLSGDSQKSQLTKHAQIVAIGPMLDDLSITEPVPVHVCHFEPFAGLKANLIWEHFYENDNRARSTKQL